MNTGNFRTFAVNYTCTSGRILPIHGTRSHVFVMFATDENHTSPTLVDVSFFFQSSFKIHVLIEEFKLIIGS